MKKLILYSMFCFTGLFMFNTTKADDWEVIIFGDYCEGKEDGFYGNLSDCRWFYECDNQQTSAGKCEAGLIYDWNLKTCQYPWSAFNPAANCPY